MATLVLGGTGKTGVHLVDQLIKQGETVKVLARPGSTIPDRWKTHGQINIITGELTQAPVDEMAGYLSGCDAVASCLGHRKIFGKPKNLVLDAVRLLYESSASLQPSSPIRFVLMNSSGCHNPDTDPPLTFLKKIVLVLLRVLLPPHPDNEAAASYLREQIGKQNPHLKWVIVRPDILTNKDEISPYSIYPGLMRDPFFNAGKTSRINVGHFMARLITDDNLWKSWKSQSPVIYDSSLK